MKAQASRNTAANQWSLDFPILVQERLTQVITLIHHSAIWRKKKKKKRAIEVNLLDNLVDGIFSQKHLSLHFQHHGLKGDTS